MPKSKKGNRPSTAKSANQNQKSKVKNNSADSKAPPAEEHKDPPPSESHGIPESDKSIQVEEKESVIVVNPEEQREQSDLEGKSDDHGTEEPKKGKKRKKNKQQNNETDEVEKQVEDIKKLDKPQERLWNNTEEQREQSDLEGKLDDHGTEGPKKGKKKKKNKQQNNETDEVEKQVEDIKKLDKRQERLWNNIEHQCKGCPEPIVRFFEKLAQGNHWTFLRDMKTEDIDHVLESCKHLHSSNLQRNKEDIQESKQDQLGDKKGKSGGKSADKSKAENQEELKKKEKEIAEGKKEVDGLRKEIVGLRRSLEAKEKEVERLQTEKTALQQNGEKIYQQLRCRDEEFLRIKNEYHKVEQNVRALNIRIKEEQDKCFKMEEVNRETAKERDEFKDRFSKLAGAKLTAGNARIQDLSDINRPQKLGEKYSELYDNEWTDALEEIQENEDLNEKEAVQKLLELFKSCVSFCQMKAEEQEMRFMSAVTQALEMNGGAVCNGSVEGPDQESELHILSPSDSKMLKDFLKAKGGTTLAYLQRVFQTDYPIYAESGPKVQDFLNQSIEVCWFSAIQDPPLAFDWNFPESSEMIDKYVKVFTKSGTKIDFVVWPVLKLHVDGDVLCKGVIQPIPEGKNKKKKKDSES